MRKNRKVSKRSGATVRTQVSDLSDKERLDHYNAVMIEDLKSGMRSIAEAVENSHTILSRKIDDFRTEVNSRFEVLEAVVSKHSVILNDHTKILNEHTKKLDEHTRILDEHTRILGEHTRILGEHSIILGDHSQRLGKLQHSVDVINLSVDDCDSRISVLEKRSA